MKRDETVQTLNITNLFNLQAEAFAGSTWHANDTAEYQAAEYTEETAAHTAAVLREIRISVHGDHARTGVRADWMEQDGPAAFIIEEKTYTDAKPRRDRQCNRCRHWHRLM